LIYSIVPSLAMSFTQSVDDASIALPTNASI